MDVKTNYLAIFSYILNIAFAIYIFGLASPQANPEIDQRQIITHPDQILPEHKGVESEAYSTSTKDVIQNFYSELIAKGFTQEKTIPLVFAKLKNQHISSIQKPDDRFWVHQPYAQLDYLEQLGRGYSKIREQLILIYGSTIAKDPLVGDIFYPLSTQYPFLSSEQQIAVQNMQFEMQRYAVQVQSSGGDIRGIPSNRSPQEILASVLDEPGVKEYQLRTSPIAKKMRQSGVEFSEASFRKAYDILLQRNGVRSSSQDIFSAREDLNNLLGESDGLKLWAAIDPVYGLIKQLASRHNVSEGQMMSAYEMVLIARQEISEAAQQRDSDPRQTVYMVQEILTDLKNQLVDVVGEPAANDFINLVNGRRPPRSMQ